MTLIVSSSAASFHSDAEVAAVDVVAAAVPFSAAAAPVFSAVAASAADGAVPTAVFLCRQPFAVPPVDVPGLAFVVASAALGFASDTSFLVPFDISDRSLDFRCPAFCPAGSPLANRSDERRFVDWRCSRRGSYYFPTDSRSAAGLDCSQYG